jgi:hypothetical protein
LFRDENRCKCCYQDLAKLRSGELEDDEVYDILHRFGDSEFVEAKTDVEKYLDHDNPQLRYIALNVLTIHWRCAEHRKVCNEFILSDPDSDNRRLGTAGLGAVFQGTRDSAALKLLLQVFSDEDEEWHIRDSAYRAILYILGRRATEQPSAARQLNHAEDVNWEHINLARRIANGYIE